MTRPACDNSVVQSESVTRTIKDVGLPDYTVTQPILRTMVAHRHPETSIGELRPDGTRPMMPWQHDFVHVGCAPVSGVRDGGWFSVEGDWNPWPYWGGSGEQPFPADLLDDLLSGLDSRLWYIEQVAKTKVLNKLSQQKLQLGVTMLEMRQTAEMTTELARRITLGLAKAFDLSGSRASSNRAAAKRVENLTRRALRGDKVAKRRLEEIEKASRPDLRAETDVLNRASNAWMEYAFGIKPLYYDMVGVGDALIEHVFIDKKSFLVSAKAGHTYDTLATQYIGTLAPGDNCDAVLQKSASVHYTVVYEMPVREGLDWRAVTGLDNPGSTAWELVRASWLIDYVFNVGDLLQSMTASKGLIFREGCKSTIQRSSLVEYVLQDPSSYKGSMPAGHLLAGKFSREVLASGVTPGVVPQIKTQLGLIQMGQALFALANWLGGKPLPR